MQQQGVDWREDAQMRSLAEQLARLERELPELEAAADIIAAELPAIEAEVETIEIARLAGEASHRELQEARAALDAVRQRLAAAQETVKANARDRGRFERARAIVKKRLQAEAAAFLLADYRKAIRIGDQKICEADAAFQRARDLSAQITDHLDGSYSEMREILGTTTDLLDLAGQWDELTESPNDGKRREWRAQARRFGCID